jgi:predicted enzyme related to lactoylglutathione lyase
MVYDRWDISHISIATYDLEAAMEHYGRLLGCEWSEITDIGAMPIALYDAAGNDVHEGLREVWSLKGGIDGSGPSLELAESAPGSASQGIWGVPDGVHQMHHMAFYVDDLVKESDHMAANGFAREVSAAPPDSPVAILAYHLSPTGMRFELMRIEDKDLAARWLQTGIWDQGLIEQ